MCWLLLLLPLLSRRSIAVTVIVIRHVDYLLSELPRVAIVSSDQPSRVNV